jgi:hypothetical protein
MNPDMFIQCDGGFGAFIILFVIISIISSAVKSAKEKKEREERARRLRDLKREGGGSSPRPQAGGTGGGNSIEDFLRELAGGAQPSRPEPEPEPEPAYGSESSYSEEKEEEDVWVASGSDVQEFLREQEEARGEREQRQRKRERERKLRETRRKQEKQKRIMNKIARRNKTDIKAGSIVGHGIGSDDMEDAYAIKTEIEKFAHRNFSSKDLKKFIAMKEILSPPVALRDEAREYPQL